MDVRAKKQQKQQVAERDKSRCSSIRDTAHTEKQCFICNIKLYCDNHTFNKGGLRRCKLQQSKEKLLQAMVIKLKDESDNYYQAVLRFDILASGDAFKRSFCSGCLLPQEMVFWPHVHAPAYKTFH